MPELVLASPATPPPGTRPLRPGSAIADRRQRQQPPNLLRVPAGSGQPPQIITSEVNSKLDRRRHGNPRLFSMMNHAATALGIPVVSHAQRGLVLQDSGTRQKLSERRGKKGFQESPPPRDGLVPGRAPASRPSREGVEAPAARGTSPRPIRRSRGGASQSSSERL